MSTVRAREKPEMFLQTAIHRGYIKNTTLPPPLRVSRKHLGSHQPQIWHKNTPFSQFYPHFRPNPSPSRSGPSDRPIQRPRSRSASTYLSSLSPPPVGNHVAAASARGRGDV